MQIMKKKRVLFVAEMYCSLEQRSSTHIMIDNIIDGLIGSQYDILLLAISDSSEREMIENIYQKQGIKVLFWESRIPRETKNKYQHLAVMYREMIRGIPIGKELLKEIGDFIQEDTILLSHSPSVESACICKQIKREQKIHYIQYWSDPISLSGILPEQFGIKRAPFWIIENKALGIADEIVYGTKILMTFQKKLFKRHEHKMRYAKVSYTGKKEKVSKSTDGVVSLIYSGNYFSKIRDIMPLYEAMKQLPQNYHLSIYGSGDIELQDTFNTEIHSRIDSKRIQILEMQAQIQICILNRACIQIPGKVFYNTDLDQRILVLLDGKYKKQIRQELEEYHRFDFCENTVDAIVDYLKTQAVEHMILNPQNTESLSPKKIADSIINE